MKVKPASPAARSRRKPSTLTPMIVCESSELPAQGWLRFVEMGEENAYFRNVAGVLVCCKIES